MNGKDIYKLLLIVAIHTTLQSSAGAIVLQLPGEAFSEPLDIPQEHTKRITPQSIRHYLGLCKYREAYQALRFLPPDTFTTPHLVRELLRNIIDGNRHDYFAAILPLFKNFLTAQELYELLMYANNQYRNVSYDVLVNYCEEHLDSDILREMRFTQLITASYNEAGKIIERELEALKRTPRDINACGRYKALAERSKERGFHPKPSLFKQMHSLPLVAAVDVAAIDVVKRLLDSGANATAADHEGESAIELARRRLSFIEGLEFDRNEDEHMTSLWHKEHTRARLIVKILEQAAVFQASIDQNSKHGITRLTERPDTEKLLPDEIVRRLYTQALIYKEAQEARARELEAYNASLRGQVATVLTTVCKLGSELLLFSK